MYNNSTLSKKVKILGNEISKAMNLPFGKPSNTALLRAQEETNQYIDALGNGLATKYSGSKEAVDDLCQLLKEMTRSNIGEGNLRTQSLEDAIPRYEAIMKRLNEA